LAWEIKRGLILDIGEFCDRWYEYVIHGYNKKPQNGHGMNGRSPDEVFLSYGPPQEVDPELLAFALLRKDQVRIYNWGFKLMGREFELDIPTDLGGAAILNRLINRFVSVLYDPDLKILRVYLDGQYICNGRPLRRASFVRPDDPVMQEKLKLQAYQRRLNKESLQWLRDEARPEIGTPERALLELTTGTTETPDYTATSSEGSDAEQLEVSPEPIFLNEEDRYRWILRKLADGKELSEADVEWRSEYEASEGYRSREELYKAELDFMRRQRQGGP
jgi:hypothetical protein